MRGEARVDLMLSRLDPVSINTFSIYMQSSDGPPKKKNDVNAYNTHLTPDMENVNITWFRQRQTLMGEHAFFHEIIITIIV